MELPRHIKTNICRYAQSGDLSKSCVTISKAFSEVAVHELQIRERERSELIDEVMIPTSSYLTLGLYLIDTIDDDIKKIYRLNEKTTDTERIRFCMRIRLDVFCEHRIIYEPSLDNIQCKNNDLVVTIKFFNREASYDIENTPPYILQLIKYVRDRQDYSPNFSDEFKLPTFYNTFNKVRMSTDVREDMYIRPRKTDNSVHERHKRSDMNKLLKEFASKLGILREESDEVVLSAREIRADNDGSDITFYLFNYNEESWISIVDHNVGGLEYVIKSSSLGLAGSVFIEFLTVADTMAPTIYLDRQLWKLEYNISPVFTDISVPVNLEEYYPDDANIFLEELLAHTIHIYEYTLDIKFSE
jgi:hypothetical protein